MKDYSKERALAARVNATGDSGLVGSECRDVAKNYLDLLVDFEHLKHGRGTEACDCPCRNTIEEGECAVRGCGFCEASRRKKGEPYHTIAGRNATIEGCPCCFP